MKKINLGYILIAIAFICTVVNFSPMVIQAKAAAGPLSSTHPMIFWSLAIGGLTGIGGITFWMAAEILREEVGGRRKRWILILGMLNWLGAALYFIMHYSKKKTALETVG